MAGSNKRPRGCMEGDGDGPEPHREMKRWRPLVLEVMGMEFLQRLLEMLEPILRRVVREEIEKIYGDSGPSNMRLLTDQNSRARFQLQFQNVLPEKLYTCDKIMSKEGKLVKISIFDTVQECAVTSVPWSSAKIEVVVLNADFCASGQENWSREAFKKHIVNARIGKRPLLLGEVVIKLDQGVGYLTDITFTDNSAWTRSGKFKLGLRLHQNEDADLREGVSGCFKVKDRRVKGNEKHHPPSLTDEIYYLEGIRKDGPIHKRLVAGGISKVQQFLQAYSIDPEKLHNMLGNVDANKKGVTQRRWKVIVKNASECPPGDELYSYNVAQGEVLIFNSIYQLLGAYLGNCFYTIDNLSSVHQISVENLKKQAFQNPGSIQLFNPAVVGNTPNPLQQTFVISDQEISSFTRTHENLLDEWTSRAFSNQTQCNNEIPYDQSWSRDPHALSSIHCSQEFTACQEKSTSVFQVGPGIFQMNHLSEEDIDEIILEYRQRELPRRWIKLITGLKFVIHIGKYLATRRSGMWHFNIERFK